MEEDRTSPERIADLCSIRKAEAFVSAESNSDGGALRAQKPEL